MRRRRVVQTLAPPDTPWLSRGSAGPANDAVTSRSATARTRVRTHPFDVVSVPAVTDRDVICRIAPPQRKQILARCRALAGGIRNIKKVCDFPPATLLLCLCFCDISARFSICTVLLIATMAETTFDIPKECWGGGKSALCYCCRSRTKQLTADSGQE
jgi:hypothetical protein